MDAYLLPYNRKPYSPQMSCQSYVFGGRIHPLHISSQELLEKLFGFCYARTSDSQEAGELCSDIVFELVEAANREGDIGNLYRFLWQVARNVYADFSDKKRRRADMFYEGDPEEVFPLIASPESGDDGQELLNAVYRQISFLTRAYREVMILFYLEGRSTAEIARLRGISETAVWQRLFSARKRIQSEVKEMAEILKRGKMASMVYTEQIHAIARIFKGCGRAVRGQPL